MSVGLTRTTLDACTALHRTGLLTPTIPSSSFPKWPHKHALTAAHAAARRRRTDGRHPHLSHSPRSRPPLIHSSQLKGGRDEESERGTEGDSRSFPTFALSPFLLSLSHAACPRLMPAAAAEGRSSFGRARTYRQASALRSGKGSVG